MCEKVMVMLDTMSTFHPLTIEECFVVDDKGQASRHAGPEVTTGGAKD